MCMAASARYRLPLQRPSHPIGWIQVERPGFPPLVEGDRVCDELLRARVSGEDDGRIEPHVRLQYAGRADDTAAQRDRLEPGVVAREPGLEHFVPAAEPVLGRSFRDRGADRVRHEQEAEPRAGRRPGRDPPGSSSQRSRPGSRARRRSGGRRARGARAAAIPARARRARGRDGTACRGSPSAGIPSEHRWSANSASRSPSSVALPASRIATSPSRASASSRRRSCCRKFALRPATYSSQLAGRCRVGLASRRHMRPPSELTPAFVAGQLLAEEHVPVELAENRAKRGSGRLAAPLA